MAKAGVRTSRRMAWPSIIGRSSPALQPADQQFAFVNDLRRQMIVQLDKEFLVADHFRAPRVAVKGLQLVEALLRELQAGPMDVLVVRHPADGRLARDGAATDT